LIDACCGCPVVVLVEVSLMACMVRIGTKAIINVAEIIIRISSLGKPINA
jgi:hypothetical protein